MCNEHMERDAVMHDITSFNEEKKGEQSYINPPRPSISIPLPPSLSFSPRQKFRAVRCTCSRELGGKKGEEEEGEKEEKKEE